MVAAATPGMTHLQAMVVTQSSTAVANTVPGGGAVGVGVTAAMYRSWGFSASRTSLAVVSTGIWNVLVKLSLPLVALALLAVTGGANAVRIVGAALGLGIVVGVVIVTARLIRDDRFARWAARVL